MMALPGINHGSHASQAAPFTAVLPQYDTMLYTSLHIYFFLFITRQIKQIDRSLTITAEMKAIHGILNSTLAYELLLYDRTSFRFDRKKKKMFYQCVV